MSTAPEEMTPHRRAMLGDKARRLYGKFCGTGGRGICAESFAVFHIGRGETLVASDLLEFLGSVVEELRAHDPEGRLAATLGLAARIRRHVAEAADSEGNPNPDLQQIGPALRQFVLDNAAEEETC